MLTTGSGQALCRPHEAVRCPDQLSQSEQHFQIVGLTDGLLRFRAYDALVALKEIEENVPFQPEEGWEVRRIVAQRVRLKRTPTYGLASLHDFVIMSVPRHHVQKLCLAWHTVITNTLTRP